MPRLLYQRWLNLDSPLADKSPPIWSFPLPLADGRALVTFLFRPLTTPATPPRTVILELSAAGESTIWKPGVGYPAPVMFYADDRGILYGYDLTALGKVYGCDVDGNHASKLAMSLKLGNLVAPEFFCVRGKEIFWLDAAGQKRQGEIGAELLHEKPATAWPALPPAIHFPHTHIVGGKLFVFDFDPMPRVSAYALA